jgi:predicted nucleic acid-binding protein
VESEPQRQAAPRQRAAILIDTDILVDHLRGARPLHLPHTDVRISVITRSELFAGARADETKLRSLLTLFQEIALDRTIAERGGRIRRYAGIPLPDALIAATALERGLEIMTRNRRHFERVDGVTIRNPDPA